MKKSERLSVRLDHRLAASLQQFASEREIGVSTLVRQILSEAVAARCGGLSIAGDTATAPR